MTSDLASLDFCYLTTTGRISGNPHRIEIWFALFEETVYLMAGDRDRSDWIRNLQADPTALTVQDGPEPFDAVARELSGAERDEWWARAVAAYPPYADYQVKTDRLIPILLAERVVD